MVGQQYRYCAYTEIRSWSDNGNDNALSIVTKDGRVLTLSCDNAGEACAAMAGSCLVVARAMQLSAANVSAAANGRAIPEGIPEPEQRFKRGVRSAIEEGEDEDKVEGDAELASIALAQLQQEEEREERARQAAQKEEADGLRRSVAAAEAAAASVAEESAQRQAAAEQLVVGERQRAEETVRDAAAAAAAQAAAAQVAMAEAVERAAEQARQAAEASSKAQIEAMEEKFRTLLSEQTAAAQASAAAAAAAAAGASAAAPTPVPEPLTPPRQLQNVAAVASRLPPLRRDLSATSPPPETWPVAPKPLRSAIRNGALTAVQQHVVDGAWANSLMSKQSGKIGAGLLYAAAQRGYGSIVQHLLVQRADPNAASSSGSTPLYTAVFNHHEAVAQILLDAGANPHAPTADGCTPLTLARTQSGGKHGRMAALLEGATNGGGGSSSGTDNGGSTDHEHEEPSLRRSSWVRSTSLSPVSRSQAAGGDSINNTSRSAASITAPLSSELESLANLRREGLLSEVEFSQAKAAIINSSLGGTPLAQLRVAAASPSTNSPPPAAAVDGHEEVPLMMTTPSVTVDYEQVVRSVSSQAADAVAMQLEVATAEHRIALAEAQRSGAAAFKKGDMEDALAHFATAIAAIRDVTILCQEICSDHSDPESSAEMDPLAMRSVLLDVLEVRAIASYNLGDFGAALNDATHCITLDGSRLAGYLRAARTLQKLGRAEEAKEYMLVGTENAAENLDQGSSALDEVCGMMNY